MFSGIIQAVGAVRSREAQAGDERLWIDSGALNLADVAAGDSIAVAGVCLSVVALDDGGFAADVSRETLARTTLGGLAPGTPVNLEKALSFGARVGGHLVSGHVDGVGRVLSRHPDGRSERFEFEVEPGLSRFVAAKGSIAIDGVSLTVNRVAGARFELNLIPLTLAETTLASLQPGSPVNVEVDLMARYAARWAETRLTPGAPAGNGS